MPEISIKATTIFSFFGLEITNSLLLSVIVLFSFLIIAIKFNNESLKKRKSGFFYFINYILKALYQLFESVLKEHADYFFPLVTSLFLFIILQNWFGLLPGVGSLLIKVNENSHSMFVPLFRGNEADLNSTLSLALLSVILIQIYSIKYLGIKGYLGKFYNLRDPMTLFTGTLEIISELSRVISFAFRLFGNIFAGEVLLTVMAFLIPILVSFPFLLLEVFVGFIQALIFSMLTAVFLNMAIRRSH